MTSLRGPMELQDPAETRTIPLHSIVTAEDYVSPMLAVWVALQWHFSDVFGDQGFPFKGDQDPRLGELVDEPAWVFESQLSWRQVSLPASEAALNDSDRTCEVRPCAKAHMDSQCFLEPGVPATHVRAKSCLKTGALGNATKKGNVRFTESTVTAVTLASLANCRNETEALCTGSNAARAVSFARADDSDTEASYIGMCSQEFSSVVHLHDCLLAPPTGSIEELHQLLEFAKVPWWDFWRRDVEKLGLTLDMLHHLACSPPLVGAPVSFCVFVDGSASDGQAGWGLSLFAFNGYQWAFVGWAGDGLQAPGSTNNDAECQGLLMALAWCMSLPPLVAVEVVVDSTFSMACAEGSHGIEEQDCWAPAVAVRFFKQWLERWQRPVCLSWTPSHAGTFGNEMADRVAAFASRQGFGSAKIPAFLPKLIRHPLLAWIWAASEKVPGLVCLEQLQQGTYEHADSIPGECAQAILDDTVHCAAASPKHVELRLCTANVCTLKNKCPVLRKQCAEEQVMLVALQETRLSSDAFYMTDGWIVAQSAAKLGQDGCAFWLNVDKWRRELVLNLLGLSKLSCLVPGMIGLSSECVVVPLMASL